MQCPCGSGLPYTKCCGLYHQGVLVPTAESLMRARYSAYALRRSDYIHATWHPDTRVDDLNLGEMKWIRLVVEQTEGGLQGDGEGWVTFIAYALEGDRLHRMKERSRFLRLDGQWYYLDGELDPDQAITRVGRNHSCPCGSGKKFKRCCFSGTGQVLKSEPG